MENIISLIPTVSASPTDQIHFGRQDGDAYFDPEAGDAMSIGRNTNAVDKKIRFIPSVPVHPVLKRDAVLQVKKTVPL